MVLSAYVLWSDSRTLLVGQGHYWSSKGSLCVSIYSFCVSTSKYRSAFLNKHWLWHFRELMRCHGRLRPSKCFAPISNLHWFLEGCCTSWYFFGESQSQHPLLGSIYLKEHPFTQYRQTPVQNIHFLDQPYQNLHVHIRLRQLCPEKSYTIVQIALCWWCLLAAVALLCLAQKYDYKNRHEF